MHGGSIIKCLDKQLLCHLHRQSRIFVNKSLAIKHHYPLLTLQNHFTNLLNSILERQILWGENSEIKQFLTENVCGREVMLATFMEMFHIKRCAAKELLSKNIFFNELPKKKVTDNYQTLKSAGFNTSLIQDNVLLLSQDSGSLQKKINILQRITNDINDGICLLYHSATVLRNFANCIQSQPKYFEAHFQIKPRDLYNIISNYIYYITQDPESTVQKIKLLLEYEVSVNSLINYNWPMYCPYEKMQTRLEIFSQSGLLPPPRPWILTCNDFIFDSRVKKGMIATDDQSRIVNFLSKMSGYSEALIRYRIMSVQTSKSARFIEVKSVVNTIIEEGYTYDDIIWSIKVLGLENNFIKQRFSKLQMENHKAPFLNILLLSNEAFVSYVNSLSKNK